MRVTALALAAFALAVPALAAPAGVLQRADVPLQHGAEAGRLRGVDRAAAGAGVPVRGSCRHPSLLEPALASARRLREPTREAILTLTYRVLISLYKEYLRCSRPRRLPACPSRSM